jgi:hypothetical protein
VPSAASSEEPTWGGGGGGEGWGVSELHDERGGREEEGRRERGRRRGRGGWEEGKRHVGRREEDKWREEEDEVDTRGGKGCGARSELLCTLHASPPDETGRGRPRSAIDRWIAR